MKFLSILAVALLAGCSSTDNQHFASIYGATVDSTTVTADAVCVADLTKYSTKGHNAVMVSTNGNEEASNEQTC